MIKTCKFGYSLLGIGIAVVLFSLISDYIGIGKPGIQAAQLMLIQFGVLLSVTSIGFIVSDSELKVSNLIDQIAARIFNLPASNWVFLGFLIAYILLFIIPVFLNSDRRIDYLTRYIPEITPIGRDLSFATSGIKSWLSGNGFYLKDLNYPPLYAVVFSPFLLLTYPSTFFVMTTITLSCMVVSSLILPSLIVKNKDRTVLFFFFLTGIFSYGMQFELERGQYNVFAFTLSFLAAYIFHRHYQFRHLAYLLISVAIQIKLYPVFFTLMLVKDWRDWKGNVLRFVGLGIFNISLLFVLGYKTFIDFINTMSVLFGSVWTRPYNHSLASFVRDLTSTGLGIFKPDAVNMLKENSSLIRFILILYYLICLAIIVGRAYKNNENGINPDLFVACTIGAMIIPSLSIDYKLPLLPPVMALALSYDPQNDHRIRQIIKAILLIVVSLAYSYTLFSFMHRPTFLANCFPLLMVILTGITCLNVVDERKFFRTESQEYLIT
ncbi:MAG: DUF2029 domain-containing protein [Chloroflexi bacterium]|nr:DUF2029 domain-containing protein [Chloroflexota bacterium]